VKIACGRANSKTRPSSIITAGAVVRKELGEVEDGMADGVGLREDGCQSQMGCWLE
jgi:hypothetical protein